MSLSSVDAANFQTFYFISKNPKGAQNCVCVWGGGGGGGGAENCKQPIDLVNVCVLGT